MKNNLYLFISPHFKKCGESYVLNELTNELNILDLPNSFKLLNTHGEFASSKNKIDFSIKIRPQFNILEKYLPWLNYRIYMVLIGILYIIFLPSFVNKLSYKYNKIYLITRMSFASISLSYLFMNKEKISLNSSFAGIPLNNLVRKIIWPLLFKNVNHVILPTNDLASLVKKFTKKNNFTILRNPVIAKNFNSQKKFNYRNFNPNKDCFKIACVGRLSKQKGFDFLIKSINKIDNCSVEIFGNGEDYEKLNNLINNLKLNKKIKLIGRVENPWRLMDNHHLFVMPSRWEGPGHTAIEALNYGIPTLVSDCIAGPQDTVGYGRYGYIFNTDNFHSFQFQINYIMNNYAEAIIKAKKGINHSKIYSSQIVAQSWLDFFKSI